MTPSKLQLGGYRHKYITKGLTVPGVTTILAVAAKPVLIPWANRLGLEGVAVADYNKNVTGIGSLVHAYIEGFLTKQEVDDSGMTDEQKMTARAAYTKFAEWYYSHDVKPHWAELSISGSDYGGTIDAIMDVDGVATIMDWKTSKDVYPEYYAQLAAYFNLWTEDRARRLDLSGDAKTPLSNAELPEVEQVAVLQVAKEVGDAQFVSLKVDEQRFTNAWKYFEACKALYYAKKVLK